MFKCMKFSPVPRVSMEYRIIDIVKKRTKSEFEKIRIGECFYVQPKDENEIDSLITSDLVDDEYLQKNNITVEPEVKSIAELDTRSPKRSSTIMAKKQPLKVETEETEDLKGFDQQVMAALQGTSLNARAQPPDEFFVTYSDPSLYFPIFLAYLLVIVLVKTGSALFSS
eukprot:TRINITY_DN1536_c0_g1_i7.p1 TRINITY_DN1536_c0_g1~~TRINITY_DN1536_c0_g1_i7.p1  ORF type:complete len:169 (+),score=70.78 TRINITY_DN1536_c0_g1_i7:179-685(+)